MSLLSRDLYVDNFIDQVEALMERVAILERAAVTSAVEATWESILNAPAGSGTNVIVVNQAPSGLAAHSSWVVIDPFTDECEIRKVIGVSDEEIELAAELGYEHTVSDLVLFVMAPVCNVKWWGAKGDGSTDDTTAIQRATTQAQLLGGTSSPNVFDFGTVYLPAGFYYISGTITLYAFVRYVGDGSNATTIALANSANVDMFVTDGFSTYSVLGAAEGGISYTTEGIPTSFSLEKMTINGRKSANTSGYGVKIYGQRYYIDDVVVIKCAGTGFYSEREGGDDITYWFDIAKAHIPKLQVRDCDGHGFHFRGPHDTVIGDLAVQECAGTSGDGIRIEASATQVYDAPHTPGNGYYSGSCIIGNVHTYGHGTAGGHEYPASFYSNAKIKASMMYIDSAKGHLLHLQANNSLIGELRCLHAGGQATKMTALASPTKVFSYTGSFTDLTNTYDGNPVTSNTVTLTTADALYIIHSTNKFNLMDFDFGGTVNAITANMQVYYYSDEDSDWRQIPAGDLTDGTNPYGKTWARDGQIENGMAFHDDWVTTTVNGVTGYCYKLVPSANLTASIVINEIEIMFRRWCLLINGDEHQIGAAWITDDHTQSGVKIMGDKNDIGVMNVDGNGDSPGIGLFLDGNHNNIAGVIHDFAGSGGIGLQTNPVTAGAYNQLRVNLTTCDTLWHNVIKGIYENFDIRGYCASEDAHYAGAATKNENSTWNVMIYDVGDVDYYYARHGYKATDAINLNVTTAQTITWTHKFIVTPNVNNVSATMQRSTNVAVVVEYLRVIAVSSTTITVQVKIAAATGAGNTAHLLIQAEA